MATMTQTAQPRIRTTITKETLPPTDNSPADAKPSPFYDRDLELVVNALTPEDWTGHVMRVYRSNEKWERGAGPVDNVFTAAFTEEDIRSRFGGGRYVLWLYGPPKRHNLVGRYQLDLEGQPIVQSFPRNGNANSPQGEGSNAVAMQALNIMQNPEFMRAQFQMFQMGMQEMITMIRAQQLPAQNPLETLRTAKEILGVGAAPQNSLLDAIHLLKELGIVGSPEKKGINEILDLIGTLKTSGLISAGVPKADLLSTFAANIPMIADRVVAGFQEARLQAEAQERIVRLQRGEIRANDPNVITLEPKPPETAAPSAPTKTQTAAAAEQALSPEMVQAILVQAHLQRIVGGIKAQDATGQDLFDYLINAWPEILPELTKFSKESLLVLFKSREMQMNHFGCDILATVGDDPRLPKMLEDFLKIAKENDAAEQAATN